MTNKNETDNHPIRCGNCNMDCMVLITPKELFKNLKYEFVCPHCKAVNMHKKRR